MARVLVLRPEPGASATVERARRLGLDAVAAPLFEIEPVAWDAPELAGFDGLLITSANAVRQAGAGLQALRGLEAYAVGEATAEAAREAGFDVAATGDAGVERLLASIEPDLRLLHLAGADRKECADARQELVPLVTYRSVPTDKPNLPRADVALIHSPRAGTRLAELTQERSVLTLVAVSEAAGAAAGSGWRAVHIAEAPTDDALLALAARLCNTPAPQ
jgi:uroporphyrinogen-III synthase